MRYLDVCVGLSQDKRAELTRNTLYLLPAGSEYPDRQHSSDSMRGLQRTVPPSVGVWSEAVLWMGNYTLINSLGFFKRICTLLINNGLLGTLVWEAQPHKTNCLKLHFLPVTYTGFPLESTLVCISLTGYEPQTRDSALNVKFIRPLLD